jgi:hypothetical protein
MLLAGCQLDRTNFKKEYYQGLLATQGVNTTLPITLEVEPFNEESVWLFLSGRMTIPGRDFSVDVANRKITWLSTAPYPVALTEWLEINYIAK